MHAIIIATVVSGLTSFLATPLTIRLARRFGLVDDAKTHLHPAIVHSGIIPRAGGLPIFLGVLLGTIVAYPTLTKQLIGVFLGGGVLVAVGLFDDKRDVSPYIRFLINLAIAVIVVGFGVGIGYITNPFGGVIDLRSLTLHFSALGSSHSIVVLADLVAVLWIVWMMNAINWSSGVDGQLPGIVAIGAAILGLVALPFVSHDPMQQQTVVLAAATSAAFLGFLPFSFYPQKIMPGYGGAALGGLLLAVLAILSGAKLATAFIVLAVPMVDGILAVLRRLSRKQSPFRGDKEHLHHHLLALGWSKRKIAIFYWLTCLVLGLAALLLDSRGKLFAIMFISIAFAGITYWLYWLNTAVHKGA